MIRKSLYPDYYHGHPLLVNTTHGTLAENSGENQWHIGRPFATIVDCAQRLTMLKEHCVDSIRQSLMCSVDISTIFWHWLPELQQSAPSAQTTHTCRDFDRVREWALEHRLEGVFDNMALF